MNFLGTLIAVLFALYLTGNVQAGSVLKDILAYIGYGIFFIFAVAAIFMLRNAGSPQQIWENFKNGKLF